MPTKVLHRSLSWDT